MSFCTFVLNLAVGWRLQGSRKVRHHAIKRQGPRSDERFTRKCHQMGGLVYDVCICAHAQSVTSTFEVRKLVFSLKSARELVCIDCLEMSTKTGFDF